MKCFLFCFCLELFTLSIVFLNMLLLLTHFRFNVIYFKSSARLNHEFCISRLFMLNVTILLFLTGSFSVRVYRIYLSFVESIRFFGFSDNHRAFHFYVMCIRFYCGFAVEFCLHCEYLFRFCWWHILFFTVQFLYNVLKKILISFFKKT